MMAHSARTNLADRSEGLLSRRQIARLQCLADLVERLRYRICAAETGSHDCDRVTKSVCALVSDPALQILTQLFELIAYLLVLVLNTGKL